MFLWTLPPFLISLLSFPALLSLLSACPGTQREKGGLGAVCLKPSRFNLLRPSTVQKKDCISYLSFSFPSHFLNPAPFSREKWLPSLFCFSSLNQGNDRKLENVADLFIVFFFLLWVFFVCFWVKINAVADYAAMCPSSWRTAGCALLYTKCQRSHNNLNPDRWPFWISCAPAKLDGPSSAQRHNLSTKKKLL